MHESMTRLMCGVRYEIHTTFKIGPDTYEILQPVPVEENGYVRCCKRQTSGQIDIVDIAPSYVPDTAMTTVFLNNTKFDVGDVIFMYHIEDDECKETSAIVTRCTSNAISYFYREVGGEMRTNMITAQQIRKFGIKVFKYPKPKIKELEKL